MARYGKISSELKVEYEKIPAPRGYSLHRPCAVHLKDGSRRECVYILQEDLYFRTWGVWPEDDRAKSFIRIEDVTNVFESPCRLPASMAEKIYDHGESGMGYHIFTIVFDDGSRMPVVAGGAVDFIHYPNEKHPENVVNVLPHIGRNDPALRPSPKYYWCLYSAED